MKELEILVVEDQEENVKAAQEAFAGIEGVNVDYAANYDEAIEKLESKVYAATIVDLNFPRKAGAEPEKIGLELGKELDVLKGKYRVPHVILTGGWFEHGKRDISEIMVDGNTLEKQGPAKYEPEAWNEAYEQILEICPENTLRETVEAKERYQRFVGRPYRNE